MTVVAYVSGHGFGHSAREVEILRHLPLEIPLVVKSAAPEWFWRKTIVRPFEFVRDSYDVGCIQTTSLEVDIPATLAAWQSIEAKNQERFHEEVKELRKREARVVVTDVASFPLTVAAAVGIPGVCVANFTWADIYADYGAQEPAFVPIVAELEKQYASATQMLETDLALPMPYFLRRESVGLVARPGTSRREELRTMLGAKAEGRRLALVYAGNWGLPVPWERLARFTGWFFLSLNPLEGQVENVSVVDRDAMPHPDYVASVDLVISKLGYGIVGECLTAGTPLLYCPRTGFAEYPAIENIVSQWAGNLYLPAAAYLDADWEESLAFVPPFGSVPCRPAPGGIAASERIAAFWANP